ncbi:MAG: terminase family protein, partial [Candidatus Cloacimonadaceae bacterium]
MCRFVPLEGFGKSYVFSVLAAWAACCNSNYRVLCISRSQRQSSEMFHTIQNMILNSPIANCVTRSTQTMLEFNNSSRIETLPGASYNSIRGVTANLVLIDEASFCLDSLFDVIRPVILTTKGRLILISTPNFSSGEFYRSCQPESEYTKFHFTHADVRFENGDFLVDPEDLAAEAKRFGGVDSPGYRREFLAEFSQAENAFFDLESVNDALKEYKQIAYGLEDRKYAIGADLAQKQDFTVFAVLDYTDRNNLQIVKTVRFNGKSTDQIMNELYKLTRAFKANNILIDDAGIGRSMIEHLKKEFPSIRWQAFNFNTKSKIELMNDLNVALCNHMLVIPDDDVIRDELVSFYYEENPETKHVKMGGKNCHDDIPIAIALAIRAANIFTKAGGLTIGSSQGILTGSKV